MQSIPFLDLKAQYRSIQQEVEDAVLEVLRSGTYILGPVVAQFEEEFAAFQQVRHGVAVNSGTSALHLALLAAGVGPGAEVITVAMTFVATAAAVRYTGATPVFVDIDPRTFTMDPAQIEAKITPRTKAIMPVHLYGQPADMDPILEIAARHNLIVIEDAAQAHGAEYKGRRVGSMGHVAGFSFYPGKNLGAYGEGGIAVTNEPVLAESMRLLRDWGQAKKYYHDLHAYNFRMDAVQGAILRVKLRHLEAWTEARRANAARYDELLADAGTRTSEVPSDRRHVYHIYSVFHPRRAELQAALLEERVATGIHYPIPVHLQKSYEEFGYRPGDLPVTEWVAEQQLSLPMFPELSEEQIKRVCDVVRAFAEERFPESRVAL